MSAPALRAAAIDEPVDLPRVAQRLADDFAGLDLPARLAQIRRAIPGRLVFTTSFGLEDQAITHAIFESALDIAVITLDTGRLFPETHDVWSATERRYGRRIAVLHPDHRALEELVAQQGIDGFRASVEARQRCCGVRKVAPLGRALAGAAGWVTGLRADQSAGRSVTPYAAFDRARGLVKVNPLLEWSRDRVAAYTAAHAVPVSSLHARGFLSIGCAPCTRAVAPGEPERAGRWWWEQDGKTECGLHTRPPRAAPALTSQG